MKDQIGKSLAVGYIAEYLASTKDPDDPDVRDLNAVVLGNMAQRFSSVTFRQFMLEKKPGGMKGKYYPSAATKCWVKNWRDTMGIPGSPLDPEVLMKFWYGDLLELGILGLIELAYVSTKNSVGFSNEQIDVPFGSRFKGVHHGRPDGLIYFDYKDHYERYGVDLKPKWLKKDGEYLVLEVKSMGDYPFRLFSKNGPDDTWGYMGQIAKMMEGLKTPRYLYVAVNREKGGIAEYVGSFEKKYQQEADAIYDVVMEHVELKKSPTVPNKEGHGLGKACADGWNELALNCSFCGHNKGCYADQGFEMRSREIKTRNGFKTLWDVKHKSGTQMNLHGVIQEIVGGTKISG